MPGILILLLLLGAMDADGPSSEVVPAAKIEAWTRVDLPAPAKKANTLMPVAETIWVGTDEGLMMVNAGGSLHLGTKDGLPHRVINQLAWDADRAELWIATMGGLARYSAGRIDAFTQLNSGLANDVVYAVAAHAGDIWAATASGTSRFDPQRNTWEIYDHTNARMHEPWCYAARLTDDKIFLGVWGGGVLERSLDGGEWRVHRDPDGQMEVDLLRDDGLVSDVVSSIDVDGGMLWAATYFGLCKYDGQRWWTWSAEDSGLTSNFVNIVRAVDGLVFTATDQGLCLYDGVTWTTWGKDASGGGIRVVKNEDGDEVARYTTQGALPDCHVLDVRVQQNDVFVGTMGGLVKGVLVRQGGESQ